MYHCGTKPVLAHIANGMYGAIIVEPKKALPKVDNEYVLVGSEWYMNGDGIEQPASLDMAKARSRVRAAARNDDRSYPGRVRAPALERP